MAVKHTVRCYRQNSLIRQGNIVLGEINVVNIIEDWDVFAEYAGEKLGFYQLLDKDGKNRNKINVWEKIFSKRLFLRFNPKF